ncbi:MAG: cation transporter [Candidatus Rokuibacteriota bacterium]
MVKRALEGLPGVSRADVSFQKKEAVVTFEPSQVSVEKMIEAVHRAGFRAGVMCGARAAPSLAAR